MAGVPLELRWVSTTLLPVLGSEVPSFVATQHDASFFFFGGPGRIDVRERKGASVGIQLTDLVTKFCVPRNNYYSGPATTT